MICSLTTEKPVLHPVLFKETLEITTVQISKALSKECVSQVKFLQNPLSSISFSSRQIYYLKAR